eukprot:1161071-Pelagomonas_calceolata.AAC.14
MKAPCPSCAICVQTQLNQTRPNQTIGERNFKPASMMSITAHTGALRQGEPSVLPFKKEKSLHQKSRTGEILPTQMAVSFYKKMTLHHLLTHLYTNRAEKRKEKSTQAKGRVH